MNNATRAVVQEEEDDMPQLQIVPPKKGASKKTDPFTTLTFPSRLHSRHLRPELAVLGWPTRATRLAGGK
jgi:hypothetical protein